MVKENFDVCLIFSERQSKYSPTSSRFFGVVAGFPDFTNHKNVSINACSLRLSFSGVLFTSALIVTIQLMRP